MAHPKPKKKTTQNGKSRLNLRLPSDLDKWAKKYAERKNTTVTQLFVDFLTDLRAHEGDYVEQF